MTTVVAREAHEWIANTLHKQRRACNARRREIEKRQNEVKGRPTAVPDLSTLCTQDEFDEAATQIASVMPRDGLSTPLADLDFSDGQTHAHVLARVYTRAIFDQYKLHHETLLASHLHKQLQAETLWQQVALDNMFLQPSYTLHLKKCLDNRPRVPAYKLAELLMLMCGSTAKRRRTTSNAGNGTEEGDEFWLEPGFQWMQFDDAYEHRVTQLERLLVSVEEAYTRELKHEDDKVRALKPDWIDTMVAEMVTEAPEMFNARDVMCVVRNKHHCGSEVGVRLRVSEGVATEFRAVQELVEGCTSDEFIKLLKIKLEQHRVQARRFPVLSKASQVEQIGRIVRHRAAQKLLQWSEKWAEEHDNVGRTLYESAAKLTQLFQHLHDVLKDPGPISEETYAAERRETADIWVAKSVSQSSLKIWRECIAIAQGKGGGLVMYMLNHNVLVWRDKVRALQVNDFDEICDGATKEMEQETVLEAEYANTSTPWRAMLEHDFVELLQHIAKRLREHINDWNTRQRGNKWLTTLETLEARVQTQISADKIPRVWWDQLVIQMSAGEYLPQLITQLQHSKTLLDTTKRMLATRRDLRSAETKVVSWQDVQQTLMTLQWLSIA